MKISIASFAFHGLRGAGMMDAFGYLETCKYRYGLDAADFWNGIIGTTEAAYIRKVREAMDEREMICANYHADGCHVWEDDAGARRHDRGDAGGVVPGGDGTDARGHRRPPAARPARLAGALAVTRDWPASARS